MANGQLINVDDMTEQHAKNTLKMLLRSIKIRKKPKVQINGDMAIQDLERMLDMLDDDIVY